MKSMDEISSVLKMKNLYIKQSYFELLVPEITNWDYKLGVERCIESDETTNYYTITLKCSISNVSEEFKVNVECVGIFDISGTDITFNEKIVSNNTVAIMFPYIRTYVTSMTSCPGMRPVIIPPININKLLENGEK